LKLKQFAFLLVTLFFFNKVVSINKKETFLLKGSFLLIEKQDTTIKQKFLIVEDLYKNNEYTQALNKALNLLKENIDLQTELQINLLISEIFRNFNNIDKSIHYLEKSLNILNNINAYNKDDFNLKDNNFYFSKIYLNLGNQFLKKGLVDSTKKYYDKVLNLNSLSVEVLSFKAKVSSNLSGIYMQDSLFDLAEKYALNAISIHRNFKDSISESAALGNLASIYLKENNFVKAKSTYKEALDLIKNKKGVRALKIREQLYFNLAFNLYELKDYEAYDFQEKSYIIKDSLRGLEIRQILEELDFKYNFDSQKSIFLEQEKYKRLKAQQIFWFIGIVALLVILTLAYIIRVKKLKEHNLELELSQTELLQNKKIDQLKSETQVRILNATIDGKESERKQIAETLHDSVSALLSSANLHLQATKKQFNGSTPLEVHKTQEIIQEASHKIRDLSHNLVSSVLLKFGLNYAVKDVAEKFSNSELHIDTDIKNIKRYHQNFEIKVYNIIHEFINNILKHSKAKNAFIKLHEIDNNLFIEISDDGLGFDKTKISQKDGLGINQIDARIQMMKGDFFIESSLNNGTKISIKLPIVAKEKPSHV
jgi:signal transduction histidine kinase